MGHLVRASRVGGKDDRQLAVAGGGGGEAVPVFDAVHDGGDPPVVGAVGEAGELQLRVAFAGGFVADQAGEEAAVYLGQDDVQWRGRRGERPRSEAAQSRGQRIEADGMGHLVRASRVGGKDDRQLAVAGGGFQGQLFNAICIPRGLTGTSYCDKIG